MGFEPAAFCRKPIFRSFLADGLLVQWWKAHPAARHRRRTAAERRFVAITDAVPGGLRPTDLALSGVAGVDLQAVSDEGSGWFPTRRLDPRAPKFYAEVLPPGRHEVHYFARVGNAGDYLAAPAQAELMYGTATRARTATTRVVIEGGAHDRRAGP